MSKLELGVLPLESLVEVEVVLESADRFLSSPVRSIAVPAKDIQCFIPEVLNGRPRGNSRDGGGDCFAHGFQVDGSWAELTVVDPVNHLVDGVLHIKCLERDGHKVLLVPKYPC